MSNEDELVNLATAESLARFGERMIRFTHAMEDSGSDLDHLSALLRGVRPVSPRPEIAETQRLHDRGLDVLSAHMGQVLSQAEIVTWLESEEGEGWARERATRPEFLFGVPLPSAGSATNYQSNSVDAEYVQPGLFSVKPDDSVMYSCGVHVSGASMAFASREADAPDYV
jgi:hypothetical protein